MTVCLARIDCPCRCQPDEGDYCRYSEELANYQADAERYRWLKEQGHLNSWWSVQGPEDRSKNIDADIDTARSE